MSEYLINQSGKSFSIPVKARPLSESIVMKGYDLSVFEEHTGRSLRFGSIFDGRSLWLTSNVKNTPLTKVDILDGSYIDFSISNGVNGNENLSETSIVYKFGGYAAGEIWLYSDVNIDPLTGKIEGFEHSLAVPRAYVAGCYDGHFIWMTYDKYLYKLNPLNKEIVRIDLDGCQIITNNILFDGHNIWLVVNHIDKYHLINFETGTHEVTKYPLIGNNLGNLDIPSSTAFSSTAYDGENIWIFPGQHNRIVRFNIKNIDFTGFSLENGINGNTNMNSISTSSFKFMASVFDGENIWLSPYKITSLVRLEPKTGKLTGYKIQGENLNEWYTSESADKTHDITFDGKNIWLIPLQTNKLVKVSSSNDLTQTVLESYTDQNGNPIRQDYINWVTPGDDFTKTAPIIDGYTRVGHKVDDGALAPSLTANIPNVQADHTVTFVYKEGEDPGINHHTITRKFTLLDGTTLRPSDTVSVVEGSNYDDTAPTITGYTCIGHQIDGGALQSGATVIIPNVQADHTVTFIYEEDGEGPDPGPEPGDKHCCTKVKIEISTCSNNKKLLQSINDALQEDECDCCDHDCCCR